MNRTFTDSEIQKINEVLALFNEVGATIEEIPNEQLNYIGMNVSKYGDEINNLTTTIKEQHYDIQTLADKINILDHTLRAMMELYGKFETEDSGMEFLAYKQYDNPPVVFKNGKQISNNKLKELHIDWKEHEYVDIKTQM